MASKSAGQIRLYLPTKLIRDEVRRLIDKHPFVDRELILRSAMYKHGRIIVKEWTVSGVRIAIHRRFKGHEATGL